MQVGALPQEERSKILDALIDNRQNKRNNPPTKNEIVSVLNLMFPLILLSHNRAFILLVIKANFIRYKVKRKDTDQCYE